MKSYHLADALTLGEVIAGVILLGMAIFRATANYAIWVFVAGELCDAFDGPCARRWPYPNDGRKRWWRTYVTQIEHLTDIFIAVACMIYLMRCNNPTVAAGALALGYIVIVICATIELIIRRIGAISDAVNLDWLILARRWFYAFGGIGGGVLLLITAASWAPAVKLCAIISGIGIGLVLFIYKLDRALKP